MYAFFSNYSYMCISICSLIYKHNLFGPYIVTCHVYYFVLKSNTTQYNLNIYPIWCLPDEEGLQEHGKSSFPLTRLLSFYKSSNVVLRALHNRQVQNLSWGTQAVHWLRVMRWCAQNKVHMHGPRAKAAHDMGEHCLTYLRFTLPMLWK